MNTFLCFGFGLLIWVERQTWFVYFQWKPSLGEASKVYYNLWASCVDISVVGIMGFPTRGLTIEKGPHLVFHPHYLKAWKFPICSPMWNQ